MPVEGHDMEDIVIVAAVRTPVESSLARSAIFRRRNWARSWCAKWSSAPALIPRWLMSASWVTCIQAGLGQNPARQAAIYGGLSPEVSAFTINKVCGSGLKAVSLAAQAIQTGNAEIIVAGGMESMTNAPYLLPQARAGYRMGNAALVDSMILDGLWDVYNDFHMGTAAEMVAAKYGICREQQDAFAAESHRRAAAATAQGLFRDEILPIECLRLEKAKSRVFSMPTNLSARKPPWKFSPASRRHSKRAEQ